MKEEKYISEMKGVVMEALYQLGAVHVNTNEWFVLKGGFKSPVFFDVATLESLMSTRGRVVSNFLIWLHRSDLYENIDAYVGVVSGGISWANSAANCDDKALLRAHAYPKNHGLRNQIDGLLPTTKRTPRVAVFDDVLTSGNSVISVVKALRDGHNGKKAEVAGVFTIFDWEFESVKKRLKEENIKYRSLFSFKEILKYGYSKGFISPEDRKVIEKFYEEHSKVQ